MWKAWLAQSDGSVVVEAMDASQDARLRLILAALILLFGIAITLVIVALSRGRKRSARVPHQPLESRKSAPLRPVVAANEGSKALPEVRPSRPAPAPQPRPAVKPQASKLLTPEKPASAAHASAPPAKASSKPAGKIADTAGAPATTADKTKIITGIAPSRTSSAPTTPPKSLSSSFDPQDYKKELAQMDPEKKRQEILQRLAEIQKDKKNAEARAAVRLPQVTAAARPSEPVRSGTEPSFTTSPTTSSDTLTKQNPAKPLTSLSEKESPLPTPTAKTFAERAFVQPQEAGKETSGSTTTSSEIQDSGSHAPHPGPSKKESQPEEDFSRLSSIQNKLISQPQRKPLSEWLRNIEGEQP